jgi:hypothetical protein
VLIQPRPQCRARLLKRGNLCQGCLVLLLEVLDDLHEGAHHRLHADRCRLPVGITDAQSLLEVVFHTPSLPSSTAPVNSAAPHS